MRTVKEKDVQVVEHYTDGATHVYHDWFPIRWKDFAKAGIRRKICKTTGKPFLVLVMNNLQPPVEMF